MHRVFLAAKKLTEMANPSYLEIFYKNLRRLMVERDINKAELSRRSGVSYAFICDIVRGAGNPSVKILESLATALKIELPQFFEGQDAETWIGEPAKIPEGYERITAVLPKFDAYLVKKKAAETQKKLSTKKRK